MPLSNPVQNKVRAFCAAWAVGHRPDLVTAADRTQWSNDVLDFVEAFKNNFASPVFQKYYEVTRKDLLRPAVAEGALDEATLTAIDVYVQRVATVPV